MAQFLEEESPDHAATVLKAPLMWLNGYTIKIESIRPYPAHHDQTIAPEEYVATLVVTKDQ